MHHNFDDSDSGYDVDTDRRQGQSFGIGGYKGRIIFLGDGTEVLTDSDDTEMFDNSEEDKDLASQVSKGTSQDDEHDDEPDAPKDQGDAAGSKAGNGPDKTEASEAEQAKGADQPTGQPAAESKDGEERDAKKAE